MKDVVIYNQGKGVLNKLLKAEFTWIEVVLDVNYLWQEGK